MPPQTGQKTIPLKDWLRFLRVADWWDRTVGHVAPGALPPLFGDLMIVKTPTEGISARDGDDIYSATCDAFAITETETAGQRLLGDKGEEIQVYNTTDAAIPGDSYQLTGLTEDGTRVVLGGTARRRQYKLYAAFSPGGTNIAAYPLDDEGNVGETAVELADVNECNWGLPGEVIDGETRGDTIAVISHGRETHPGTLAEDMPSGESADVNLTIAGETVTVVADCARIPEGYHLASGETVWIAYRPNETVKWGVIEGPCPVADEA